MGEGRGREVGEGTGRDWVKERVVSGGGAHEWGKEGDSEWEQWAEESGGC